MAEAQLAPRPTQTSSRHPGASLLESAQSMLVLTAIALFFITFTLQPFRIPSASMEPTLLVGDFLLVDKNIDKRSASESPLLPASDLRRGDIIVFHDPVDPTKHLIKRIVALPGDRIRLRAGRVLLNGKPLDEPYAVHRPTPPDLYRDNFPNAPTPDSDVDARWWIQLHTLVDHGDLPIPPGTVFVLGDNRNDSLDSRYWGLVPRVAIVGRPWLIYLSLNLPDDDPQSESAASLPQAPLLTRFARWDRTLTLIP